jgi:hypothetical protein
MRNTKQGSSGNLVWTSISDGFIRRLDRFQCGVFRSALEAVGIGFPFEIANGCARPAGVTYSPRDRKEGH